MRLLLISISLLLFVACESSTKSIDDFDPNRIIVIDTSTIKASTVLLDPLVTSGMGLSVGRYEDPHLGIVSAKAFAEVGLGNGFWLRHNNESSIIPVEYDSLVFITYYSDHPAFYGDTLKEQVISVHQLKKELEFDDSAYNFYSNSEFEYEAEPLGQVKFQARPRTYSGYNNKSALRIPLSDVLGRNIMRMAKEENDTLQESYKWKKYFQGIVLNHGVEDDASILKFTEGDTLMKMRLYYHQLEGESAHCVLYHDFPVRKNRLNFTNYKADRSETVLAELKEREKDINSSETEDLTFIQSGTGLVTKLEIPHWDRIILREDIDELLKVELELYPLNLSYREYAMPHPLNVYVTNEKNRILNKLCELRKGDEQIQAVESLFYYNGDILINSHFKIDLTTYLKPMLEDFESENIQLLIMPNIEAMGNFVERIVFTNEKKSDYKFKLKATFKKKM